MKFCLSDCGRKESRQQAYLRGILSAFCDPRNRDSLAFSRLATGANPLPFIPAIHILELLALAVSETPTTRTGFLRNVIVDVENDLEQFLDGALHCCVRVAFEAGVRSDSERDVGQSEPFWFGLAIASNGWIERRRGGSGTILCPHHLGIK